MNLTPAVRIELPGGGHQPEVPLADQIDQRHAAVLELLGDRDDEPHVVARQLLLGGHVAPERLPGQLHLLVTGEQRDPADFVEVQVETFATLVDRLGDLGRPNRAPLSAWLHRHFRPSLGYLDVQSGRGAVKQTA